MNRENIGSVPDLFLFKASECISKNRFKDAASFLLLVVTDLNEVALSVSWIKSYMSVLSLGKLSKLLFSVKDEIIWLSGSIIRKKSQNRDDLASFVRDFTESLIEYSCGDEKQLSRAVSKKEKRQNLDLMNLCVDLSLKFDNAPQIAWSKYNLAKIKEEIGQYDSAHALFYKAQIIYEKQEMLAESSRCIMRRGTICRRREKYKKALSLFKEAKQNFTSLNLGYDLAQCKMNEALTYLDLGLYEKTQILLNESQERLLKRRNPIYKIGRAKCNMIRASVHDNLGEFYEALRLNRMAKGIFETYQIKTGVAACNANAAGVYFKIGNFEKAEKNYRDAMQAFKEINDESAIAKCEVNLANFFQLTNKLNRALHLYQKAKIKFEEKKMNVHAAKCDMNLANILQKKDRCVESLNIFRRIRRKFAQRGMVVEVARCDLIRAIVHQKRSRVNQAMELYERTRSVFKENNLCIETAICNFNLAGLYSMDGKHDRAENLLKKARKVFKQRKIRQAIKASDRSIQNMLTINETFMQVSLGYDLFIDVKAENRGSLDIAA